MSKDAVPEFTKQQSVTVIQMGPGFEQPLPEHLGRLSEIVVPICETADPPLVVVDLSQTRCFDSTVLAVLVRAWRTVEARHGGRFAITGLTAFSASVLATAKFDRLWNIYPTREEAVRALSSSCS